MSKLSLDPKSWAACIDIKKLSKRRARMEIAKDVQKHILSDRWRSSPGEYIDQYTGLNNKCSGCAMGALFYTAFGKYDGKAEEFIDDFIEGQGMDDEDIVQSLSNLFSEKQLKTIEAAFEGYSHVTMYDENDNPTRTEVCGEDWQELHGNANDRLFAIMQNIIDNGGKFEINDLGEDGE